MRIIAENYKKNTTLKLEIIVTLKSSGTEENEKKCFLKVFSNMLFYILYIHYLMLIHSGKTLIKRSVHGYGLNPL